MLIELNDIGKRFNRDWIFRHVNLNLEKTKSYAILGSNGSGKSTLLKLISGFVSPTEGTIKYTDSNDIPNEAIFKYVSIAAPYIEVYDEFTIPEIIDFQAKLKSFSLEKKEIIETLELPEKKRIRDFSSGMRQKLKLALAFYSSSPILLLDEPTINLDAKAKDWYSAQIESVLKKRLIIVSSNYEKVEYDFVQRLIQIENFKAQ